MTPRRIQRKRTKGWRMPANTVYVGRPTIWGNRYTVNGFYLAVYAGTPLTQAKQSCVDWFESKASDEFKDLCKVELRGKNLACWCPLDQPCHADVLLSIANSHG